jgi:hypothetical protein
VVPLPRIAADDLTRWRENGVPGRNAGQALVGARPRR